MKLVISQPMFFPWIGFFEQIKLCNVFVNYNDVQFSKGSFVNRVQIKSPEGSRWLTVPLMNLRLGQTIDEVMVDRQHDWRKQHLALLKRSYQQAPYYLDMLQVVEGIYGQDWERLHELSLASVISIADYFGLLDGKELVGIKQLDVGGSSSERVLSVALKAGADTYITGHGARKYLNHETFEKAGVEVEYMNYAKAAYPQLHEGFTPYVSTLDLIANIGKAGAEIINSGTVNWKEYINERS